MGLLKQAKKKANRKVFGKDRKQDIVPSGQGRKFRRKKEKEALLREVADSVRDRHLQASSGRNGLGSSQGVLVWAGLGIRGALDVEKCTYRGGKGGHGQGWKLFDPDMEQLPTETKAVEQNQENADARRALNAKRQSIGVNVQQGAEFCPPPVSSCKASELPPYFDQLMNGHLKMPKPSPVQAQLWPATLTGIDVIGIANTGSGKTLAYLLPAATHVLAQPRDGEESAQVGLPKVLILLPTRELALQVAKTASALLPLFGLRTMALYGGTDRKRQEVRLSNSIFEIITATPGRIVDLLSRSSEYILDLRRVTFLVLDECDMLLKLGFDDQMESIISNTNSARQTLLLSATFPAAVQAAAKKWLAAPFIKIRVKSKTNVEETDSAERKSVSRISEKILQEVHVFSVEEAQPDVDDENRNSVIFSQKKEKLVQYLSELYWREKQNGVRNVSKAMVFVNTAQRVRELTAALRHKERRAEMAGIQVDGLFGRMVQEKRELTMKNFKGGKTSVLISTDVAGRGVDVKNLPFVFNFDCPVSIEQYIHRVGRTGRQGKQGHAVTFVGPSDGSICRGLIPLLKETKQTIPKLMKLLAKKTIAKQRQTISSPATKITQLSKKGEVENKNATKSKKKSSQIRKAESVPIDTSFDEKWPGAHHILGSRNNRTRPGGRQETTMGHLGSGVLASASPSAQREMRSQGLSVDAGSVALPQRRGKKRRRSKQPKAPKDTPFIEDLAPEISEPVKVSLKAKKSNSGPTGSGKKGKRKRQKHKRSQQ